MRGVVVLGLLLVAAVVHGKFHTSVSEESMVRCHTGDRSRGDRCTEYQNLYIDHPTHGDRTKRALAEKLSENRMGEKPMGDGEKPPGPPPMRNGNITGLDFPDLDEDACFGMEYGDGTTWNHTNNYGNCVEWSDNGTHRFLVTNGIPDYYVNPYCPIGLGFGYCMEEEIKAGMCFFANLTCGEDNGPGSGAYGDFPVPRKDYIVFPLKGNPTRPDRPGDAYDAETVGAAKTSGPANGVAINGIMILGPNDAGDMTIDSAGFQLACGGHVTPPLDNGQFTGPFAGAPHYHYHKPATCLEPMREMSQGLAFGGTPNVHSHLVGWALDGFGIYGFEDVNGEKPVTDECGGHFGPTDTGEVEYHYHSRMDAPYHTACQGPSLGKCSETQRKTSFCAAGCGYEVCIQPGTSEKKLESYLNQWEEGKDFLKKHTHNPYNGSGTVFTATLTVVVGAFWLALH